MASKTRLGILGSGRGTNFLAIQNNIIQGKLDAETAIVLSDKKSKILEHAKHFGLETKFVDPSLFADNRKFDKELIRLLKSAKVELVILAGYMKILSAEFINAFPSRIMNIHPSLLPSFKGLNAQRQALEYGVKYSGCTVHFVNSHLDAGPIILQSVVPVLDTDSVDTLAARILDEEHKIYTQAIDLYHKKKLRVVHNKVKVSA
ncbi:MAG: phosphoribosylglycinamide formyltransferase [Candidatus Margulisbacteria bacterium]|nr:phosphoribosylglycinamide formyltransferase [Candidatus Margulisiibacteriota bacterium]